MIDTIGIVDFFTLLSHSWQNLALIRLLRYGEQLEHFNTVVTKYDYPPEDAQRIVEVLDEIKKVSQKLKFNLGFPIGATDISALYSSEPTSNN